MANTFRDVYFKTFKSKDQSQQVLKSANVIISANMAQGDALKRVTSTGNPIIFSEWKPIGKNKVQRTEYTFDAIVEGGGPIGSVRNKVKQLSLFDETDENDEPKPKKYLPVKWEDVYKQLTD